MKTYLCSHLVTIRWSGGESVANLESISSEIATVNSEAALPVGAEVEIAAGSCLLQGTVTRCSIDMAGHEIAVALAAVWSPEVFIPDHLFDPGVMMAR